MERLAGVLTGPVAYRAFLQDTNWSQDQWIELISALLARELFEPRHPTTERDKALVYVASFGLDEGVSTNGSVEGFHPSAIPPALRPLSYPNGAEAGTEYSSDPELFPEVFAADLPTNEAKVLAYSQRPASRTGFAEPLAVTPGWKKTPSWFIVATADRAINPDSDRAAAQRMDATTSEIDGGSHAIVLSQPDHYHTGSAHSVHSGRLPCTWAVNGTAARGVRRHDESGRASTIIVPSGHEAAQVRCPRTGATGDAG